MKLKFDLKIFGVIFGIIVFFAIILFGFSDASLSIKYMAAITAITAIWWITEAMPLSVTSLIPFVLIPLFGIMNATDVATEYFNSTILIYIGGFIIALAMQKWNLHKRISILLIKIIGTSPEKIILGFMISSAFLSMFISNVATTVMLLPIGLAIIVQLEELFSLDNTKKFSVALMLGIAYSASIGGIGTLIGTAPNLIFKRVYEMNFPEAAQISFANWMFFAMPLAIILLIFAYIVLVKLLFKPSSNLNINKEFIENEYKNLGKVTYEEKAVLIVFIATALLWLTRTGIDLGVVQIKGWSDLLTTGKYLDDGSIAIFSALLLFLLPSKKDKTNRLLDGTIIRKIPWDVVLIFGGGFALAKGFSTSGLSEYIGQQFHLSKGVNNIVLSASISFAMTFLTEVTSNTATSNTILPILASIASANSINPLILMLPATISASMAFMLPVATPPNAVVYGSGKVRIIDMVKAGILLNLIGVVVITVLFLTLGAFVYGF